MRLRPAALVLTALAVAGCGATPPQAPPGEAARLDSSLGGISSACGLAYQVSAFARPGAARLGSLEASGMRQADKLASVYARNPSWIYQGKTVRAIVHEGLSTLGACGLSRARAELARRTGG